jgi:hypothetical protein
MIPLLAGTTRNWPLTGLYRKANSDLEGRKLAAFKSFNSLLGRLQHTSGSDLNDCLREILEYPDGLDDVVRVIDSKIDKGDYIQDDILAKLIIKSQYTGLYQKVRERLLNNDWTALALYKSAYPDPDIENILCDRLFKVQLDDAQPLRRHIVNAMAEVGSKSVLPTLEAVLVEIEPSVTVRTMFFDSLGTLGALEAKSREAFLSSIANAINAVSTRASDDVACMRLRGGPRVAREAPPIAELIAGGESEGVEFKSTLRTNLHTGQPDEKMQMAVLKTIAAFLNAGGGTLLIGVADDGKVIGLAADGFVSDDKMSLHLVNLLRDRVGELFLPYVHPEFVQHDGGRVLSVRCERGPKPAFVKDGSMQRFFVRGANATVELLGPSVIEYSSQRFK